MRTFVTAAVLCLATTASFAADGCGHGLYLDGRGICRPGNQRVEMIERPGMAREVVVERRAPVVREVIVNRPAPIEREVIVNRPAPIVREVIVNRPAPVVREVIVNRPAPVVREVVVNRPVVPTCGLRVGPLAVRGAC